MFENNVKYKYLKPNNHYNRLEQVGVYVYEYIKLIYQDILPYNTVLKIILFCLLHQNI